MPASVRARTHSSRPYDRRSPTTSPKSPFRQSSPPASPTVDPPDHPGLPTFADYKRIEAGYLLSLSPRKRDKALITQAMFDKIWDVLHQPDACTIETPQFRFWVRKMFTLSRPETDAGEQWQWGGAGWQEEEEADLELERTMGIERDADAALLTSAVVLHENRPVAIMEQLYELFCYCHVRAGHGGRDKTCAVIREHYSWVPKELTAQFVKACPTCALKRSGGGDLGVTVFQRRVASAGRERRRMAPALQHTGGLGWPTTGGPLDPANPQPCGVREQLRRPEGAASNSSSSPSPGSRSGPAPKEVPSRWNSMSRHSPMRVYDPAHTRGTTGFPHTGIMSSASEVIRTPEKTGGLPSLASALSNESLDDVVNLTRLSPHDDGGACLPPALRPLRLSGPVSSNTKDPDTFPIDPVLLSFSYPGLRHSVSPGRPGAVLSGAGTPEARGHADRSVNSSSHFDDRTTVRLRCARESTMLPAFNMPDSPPMRVNKPFLKLSNASPSRHPAYDYSCDYGCGYSLDKGPFARARLLPCVTDSDIPGRQLDGTPLQF